MVGCPFGELGAQPCSAGAASWRNGPCGAGEASGQSGTASCSSNAYSTYADLEKYPIKNVLCVSRWLKPCVAGMGQRVGEPQ